MRRSVVVVNMIAALLLQLAVAAGAGDRVVTGTSVNDVAFGGGGAGGGVTPIPPQSTTPPPTLGAPPGNGPVLLSVLAPQRRVVVLRSGDGRVLDVRVTGADGRVLLQVPAGGALLDVLGTDALAVPVRPMQRLTVLAD